MLWTRAALAAALVLSLSACLFAQKRSMDPLTGDPTKDYLVAYYPLHGEPSDKSGHGFHAALPGGDLNPQGAEGPSGAPGTALEFDGKTNAAAGDFLEVSAPRALEALKPEEAITVAAWAYSDDWKSLLLAGSGKAQDRSLVSTAEGGGWALYAKTNGKIVFSSYVAGDYLEAGVYLAALSPGWHHLAGTYDSATGEMRFYVDGAQAASAEGRSASIDYSRYPNATLIIGADAEAGGGPEARQDGNTHFMGRLAEVRIYQAALAPAAIAAVAKLK